jgi:hypothetical protein
MLDSCYLNGLFPVRISQSIRSQLINDVRPKISETLLS